MITRQEYLEHFKIVTNEMYELTRKKNNDYGGETDPWKNFHEFGLIGIVVRMGDKWARIKTALWEKRALEVAAETVTDTLMDLAVYAVIAIIWIKTNGRTESIEYTVQVEHGMKIYKEKGVSDIVNDQSEQSR